MTSKTFAPICWLMGHNFAGRLRDGRRYCIHCGKAIG